MTTVGFGDLFTKNFFGQISMSLATFLGAILMALYLISANNFLCMDINERQAYIGLRRKKFKETIQKETAIWLTCQIKLRFIRKMRQVSGRKKLMEQDLFYWETRSM